jgi:DNA-binding GntR family transcriptional regulator
LIGEHQGGSQLPTKREIAALYGVTPSTVDAAMIVLKTEGLVRGHQGRGVFVVEGKARTEGNPAE